ncbi:MAG: type III secretion system gatekeeper subunit SctW [Chlamydiia bacterium]|nr:type III secretion system gatekeeper subunit SctW [Chlamydiia bacterium]
MTEPNISHLIVSNAAAVRLIQQEALSEEVVQVESADDLSQYLDQAAFAPLQRLGQFKELHELRSGLKQHNESVEEVDEPKVLGNANVGEAASRFQKNNYELSVKTLLILRGQIRASDSPEEALRKVRAIYPDPSLADEALDFLLETAEPEMLDTLRKAKSLLQAESEREIKAGRNMGVQAREFSKEGLGSPSSLRDMYRDITGNAREPLKLFNELAEKFQYDKLKLVIHFMLHSLGSDLRAKGPSIPRGELKRLIDETRSLQGILGVFRFFQSRMQLIQRQFTSYHLSLPARTDFEMLAKTFVKLLGEKYINPEKILQTAKLLGVDEEVAAQIVLYTQMRDALKQIAPRYFRNPQHKDELWKAYIAAIENLEDLLEDEEEEKNDTEEDE